jgi:hypothetical protein
LIYNISKFGADNPSFKNDTNLGQLQISIRSRFEGIFEAERCSMFSQLKIWRLSRFGRLSSGRVERESQLPSIVKDLSDSCWWFCFGKFRYLHFVIDNFFKDVGKQSPGKDIADEQSVISKLSRDVGKVMAIASNTDSITSVP